MRAQVLYADANSATSAAEGLRSVIGRAGFVLRLTGMPPALERTQVTTDGARMHIALTVTDAEVRDMLEQVEPFLRAEGQQCATQARAPATGESAPVAAGSNEAPVAIAAGACISIRGGTPLRGAVSVGPDPAIAQAALLLCALCEGPSELDATFEFGDDVAVLRAALSALGVAIDEGPSALRIEGQGLAGLQMAARGSVDCGASVAIARPARRRAVRAAVRHTPRAAIIRRCEGARARRRRAARARRSDRGDGRAGRGRHRAAAARREPQRDRMRAPGAQMFTRRARCCCRGCSRTQRPPCPSRCSRPITSNGC